MRDPASLDRYVGCLLGLEASEAYASTVYFDASKAQPIEAGPSYPYTPIVNGLRLFNTAMAYWLAQVLLSSNGLIPHGNQVQHDMEQYREGNFDSPDLVPAYRNYIVACVSAEQSGNIRRDGAGSLSSLAPLPMYFGRHIDQAMGAGGLSALVTPAKRNAQDACRYLGGLLVGAFLGDDKTRLLSPYYPSKSFWDDPILDQQIVKIAAGSFKRRAPPASIKIGDVSEALTAALWAFWISEDFRSGATRVVELGDDAGVTASIYGQIAGAYYGTDAIPTEWRELCLLRLSYFADSLHTNTIRSELARLDVWW